MKEIITGDGSLTFLSDKYNETYHSTSGAEEEAVKKYAEPTGVLDMADKRVREGKEGVIRVLDICFGFGYNSAAIIDYAKRGNPDCKVEIVALENDKKLLDTIQNLNPSFQSYYLIKALKSGRGKVNQDNVSIKHITGDAREEVKKLDNESFDICLFDPFSPRTQPEMWEEGFFNDIGKKMKVGGVLSTYSCATKVRINLVRAGFDVKDGPCVGRRSPSTIAFKLNEFGVLPKSI